MVISEEMKDTTNVPAEKTKIARETSWRNNTDGILSMQHEIKYGKISFGSSHLSLND